MDDCISRKAAIDALADYIHNVDKVMGTGHLTADDCKDAAASVFEELPSAQPEILACGEGELNVPDTNVGDIISRQAAIDDFDGVKVDEGNCTEYDIGFNDGVDLAISKLSVLPSAQPERKKGKWNERKVFDTEGSDIAEMQSAKCSACGKYHTTPYLYFFDNFNYCPNCGADMRGEKDE